MNTSSNGLRKAFLDFFKSRDHRVVSSSSLVPGNDPTLLFTNAGMVQFKDVFLGADRRAYQRAVTSQRCVRAGGKHNDLDQVGYTARHHTFFEMLGNFSFGDYFKSEAIAYAWEFLTEIVGLPAERLWVTVYKTDDEAYAIWKDEVGVPTNRIIRIGDKGGKEYESDNFWAMGETGPCGPCSEIFYDHGPDVAGGPPGTPEEDGDRYIEIWNLVFMQFDRDADGNLKPLPKPCVDTGMGLERLAAVLQGVHNNYDTDQFKALIRTASELTGEEDRTNASLRVLADHIRACSFLIVDGVLPSNEGRGYVLRRIIRRAVRHGYKLGASGPFFHHMVDALVREMGDAYPELAERSSLVISTLKREEERFFETLSQGMKLLDEAIGSMEGDIIPGAVVFKLYDTFGFPADLTADVARERSLQVDMDGFNEAMDKQRKQAQAAEKFSASDHVDSSAISSLDPTQFTGYTAVSGDARIVSLLRDGASVDELRIGESGIVLLDRTPFYAESGGQLGDTGTLHGAEGGFSVEDTKKLAGSFHAHEGTVENGVLRVGATVRATIDEDRRSSIIRNHSATHLMHAALREVLGSHVEQKGSEVSPDRLRFDFSHHEPMTDEEIVKVEMLVNKEIQSNVAASEALMSYEEAIEAGAMALFGEKYGDEVRVMRFGDFSVELCGGTHVARVGDIGLFKIISETGIASGVRRVEAVTGQGALAWVQARDAALQGIARALKTKPEQVVDRTTQMVERNRELEKELERLKQKLASNAGADLASNALDIAGIKVLAEELKDAEPKSLRDTIDQLRNKLGSSVVVLVTSQGSKVSLAAGVSKDLIGRIKAGDVVNIAAEKVGGRGGGRPDMAQAGGGNPEGINEALAAAREYCSQILSA